MSGAEPPVFELPTMVVTRTPIQRARTKAILPPAEPDPPPAPVTPGPDLEVPLKVVRQPRAGISINGVRADRLLVDMHVTNNRYSTADSFRCSLVLVEQDKEFGRNFWQDCIGIRTELFVGFGVDEPPSKSLLSGRVDEIQIDLVSRRVSLTGRDFTADLIETRIAEKYPNKTASEIATIMADKVGLTPEVTATTKRVGTYYGAEHASLADETTAWNLLTYLAERESFDVYVTGTKLVFGPPPDEASASKWTLVYTPGEQDAPAPQASVMNLQLTKSLTIAREIVVKVISWHSGKKKALTGISNSKPPKGPKGSRAQTPANYVFRIPNLTQDEADATARQKALDLTKNLRSFEAELPGHVDFDIRTIVTITGTGGTFDTKYHLDEVERSVSQSQGFTMRLRGRNVIADDSASL